MITKDRPRERTSSSCVDSGLAEVDDQLLAIKRL